MPTRLITVLAVSDDQRDVTLLQGLLDYRWDSAFKLLHVEDIDSAVRLVRDKRVDAILLDLSLREGNGLAGFLKLYARAKGVPIVVLSSVDDESLAMKAVQAGAQDYLFKRLLNEQLLVRSVRYAIERAGREQAEETLRMAGAKLRVARDIQRSLFPTGDAAIPGFEAAGTSIPADEAGGDFFDYFPLAGGSLGVVVADVSGHGLGAALLMAETRAYLRALAVTHDHPGRVLTLANRILIGDTQGRHFVTLFFARLDPADRTITYAGAGHAGHLVDPAGETRLLESTSLPLGIEESLVVPCAPSIPLTPGQIVLICTDGITEAISPGREMFALPRALRAVREAAGGGARQIVDALYRAVDRHTAGQPQNDDITALAIKAT
jgi:serine phosphatase RsbU (regulator of sigma subunit)